jgi:hypothetical protein
VLNPATAIGPGTEKRSATTSKIPGWLWSWDSVPRSAEDRPTNVSWARFVNEEHQARRANLQLGIIGLFSSRGYKGGSTEFKNKTGSAM